MFASLIQTRNKDSYTRKMRTRQLTPNQTTTRENSKNFKTKQLFQLHNRRKYHTKIVRFLLKVKIL